MRTPISSILGAGVFVVAAVALAESTSAADLQSTRCEVFDLQVVPDQFAPVDVGAPGLSVGDMSVFSSRLFRNGRPFGNEGGTCQVTGVSGTTFTSQQCTVSIRLPDGQVSAQGLWDGTDPLVIAVTGGTGRYDKAHGFLRVAGVGTPNESFHLEIKY